MGYGLRRPLAARVKTSSLTPLCGSLLSLSLPEIFTVWFEPVTRFPLRALARVLVEDIFGGSRIQTMETRFEVGLYYE